MPRLESGVSTAGQANVDENFAERTFLTGGVNPFFINGITGVIGAAQNGDIFAARLNPSAGGSLFAHIRSITCWYRCVTGFTVPSTFRQLRLRRFTGTVASGGTAIATIGQKDALGSVSNFNAASGGDARFSATTVLTSPGTPDTLEVAERITLTNYGSIGDEYRWTWNFDPTAGRAPLILGAGHSIAIGTTSAFDAGGAWELGGHIELFEGRKVG